MSEDNAWYQKYFEFLDMFIKASQGRYPIGQPVLYGPATILAAIMPQQTVLCGFHDSPDQIKRFIKRATEFSLDFLHKQKELIPKFYVVGSDGGCVAKGLQNIYSVCKTFK